MSLLTSLRSTATVALGRTARTAARLRAGGTGGTALPGLVVEKTDPGFLRRTLDQLPLGVVVVSGTNGKTTTTKMLVQLLEEQGLTVLTNRTGSNFVRGVLASLLTEVSFTGRTNAHVAVLELDEAHAVRFVDKVRPRGALLLNVMRDQLDRFGEIDYTATLLRQVAQAATGVVVTNADDPRLSGDDFLEGLGARVSAFGVGQGLRDVFLSDDELRGGPGGAAPSEPSQEGSRLCPPARVTLESLDGQQAVIRVDGEDHPITFTIPGVHNQLNAVAALTMAVEVMGERLDLASLLGTLSRVEAAFGRGEVLNLDGRQLELSLVKNPAGFRMSLLTAEQAVRTQGPETVMVAINDEHADGRDMSWLWDVDFSSLREGGVSVVAGVRAWDMALRLRYDGIEVGEVEPDLSRALDLLRQAPGRDEGHRMRVFTSYTAMLALRARLAELTEVEEVMK